MLFASGTALGTQLQTAPAGFSLRSTMNPVMRHARPSRSSSHAGEAARKPRQHTQTVCPQEIKGCTQKGFKFQKQTYCTRLGRLAACQTFKLSRLGAVVIINLSTCYAIVTPMECFCD